jgi:predicted ATPase/DNA-binding CsgD family transcriptional regulator
VEHRPVETAAKRNWLAIGSAVPDNLPRYLTSFIGRGTELSKLKHLLGRSRMVTITGPGGAGKTRLATELARACLDRWPRAVWWVDLAAVSDPDQVDGAVVSALALPGQGPAREVVIAWLGARRALLMLDNCEHLAAACSEFCQTTLERCPELTIVATSREALGVPGEAQRPISSLQASDAVHLFEARAQLVLPDFKVGTSNLDPVSEICERLDRLPLAIELAAARVGLMADQEILSQLNDRFRLLTGGSRTTPERQRTMMATIDWSYRLLTADESTLFRRFSVFRGGFTLESAQAVCADRASRAVLDLIASLVHKSMVAAERTEGSGVRYRLLESQLAYAEIQLQEAGELDLIRRRHCEYFSGIISAKIYNRSAPQNSFGVADAQWARESGNLWAALGWARDNAADLGLGLAAELTRLFTDLAQSRRLIEEVLSRSPAQGLARAYAIDSAFWAAYYRGDYVAALTYAEAALALARDLGDADRQASALYAAGITHIARAELATAAGKFEVAIALVKGSTNQRLVGVIGTGIAYVAIQRGDCVAARDIMSEHVIAATAAGDIEIAADFRTMLAWAQLGLNRPEAAATEWKEALSILSGLRHRIGILDCLEGLSCVAETGGDDRRAIRLAAAASRMAGEISYIFDPWELSQSEDSHRRSRARLGTRRSQEAWNQGWSLSSERAIDYALGQNEPGTFIDAGPLSRRELSVTKLVAAGMTNRQIAEELFIAERTAEGHIERIRNKLAVHSRTEVATWAVEQGHVVTKTPMKGGPAKTLGKNPTSRRVR